MDTTKIIKAGEIAKTVKAFAKEIVKPGTPLLEIAEKIEAKIIELGGKPAFPTNLSINNIAAHYTPTYNDEALAHGLLKVDFGVHVDGWTADTAFSVDLDNTELNKKLINAAESALVAAQEKIKIGISTSELGKAIQTKIENAGFNPIINLSGHEMKQYELHAGLNIPNIDDNRLAKIKKGLYAIEPFASTGTGKVHDGAPSTIYQLQNERAPRSPIARTILTHIVNTHQTLPFCSRWIVNKFGTKALLGLRELERNGNLHHFAQLVEKEGVLVSQAENTVLVEDKVIITTE